MIKEFHTKRSVEFVDVDQAGIVHFSRFFVFMETAEHEFLRSIGTSVHTQIDGKQIGWPRLAASCEYFKPARFEDQLEIEIRVARKGRTSMTYEFTFRKDRTLIAQGHLSSVCCVLDPVQGLKPIAIPAAIASQLEPAKRSKGFHATRVTSGTMKKRAQMPRTTSLSFRADRKK